jgi:hypothetical protein
MELWTFFNSCTRPSVNRVLQNQLVRDVLGGLWFALQALFSPPDLPTQLQTV